jgi:hypothetical protein
MISLHTLLHSRGRVKVVVFLSQANMVVPTRVSHFMKAFQDLQLDFINGMIKSFQRVLKSSNYCDEML